MNVCLFGYIDSDLFVASPQTSWISRVFCLIWAGLVLAALLVVIAHNTVGFGTGDSFFIEEWVYDFVTMSAALATLLRAAVRTEERLAWGLLGFGLLSWALADLYWTVLLRDMAEPPFPNGSDAFYLVGYGLILAGMVAYVRSRVGRMSAIVWTDVAMGALCVTAIGSSLLMDYVLANTTGTPTQIAVAIAYPALDLIILAVAAGAVALTGWRPGRALGLVAVGVACGAVGDGVYTYQSLAGTYTAAAWNNFLWPLATVLIAAAALQPSPRHRETAPAEGWRAFASPTIFALGVFALLLLERQDMNEPAVTALTIATLIAVIVRLVLTFAQNHRLVIELETDPLTGLFNRGKLVYDLDRLLSADEPDPHLLAILDLDGFKAYNDAFGHPAGDALLIRLGHQLAAAVGDAGRAYRMGGDEFAMLIPGNSGEATRAVDAGAAALSEHGEGFEVTCSCGSAEIPAEATDRSTALQLADQRMYGQKDSRRPSPGGEVEAVLIRVLNQRAPELGEHGNAVKSLALAVGRDMSLPPGELATLSRASELHDVGKIAIPDAILNKRTPLDDEEWEFIRQHTILGERIVSAAPSLASVGRLIRASHERWDGDGYPDGLRGESIPLAARIIFVCDAYDAITADRPYSPARGPETALEELRRGAGSQFDSDVVVSLERVLRTTPPEDLEVPQPIASRSAASVQ
jgi:two-component system, cell cycle response regulator